MALGLLGLIASILVLLLISRTYTTKLQDRIIKLEMKVRGDDAVDAGAAGGPGAAQQAADRRAAVCVRRGTAGARRAGRSREDDGRSDQAGDQELGAGFGSYVVSGLSRTLRGFTPAMFARTLNTVAKSSSTRPMARAVVRILVRHGGRRQRDVDLPAQLERQHHVLLHHVHVEPRLVRHLQHERPTVDDHRRRDRRCASARRPRSRAGCRSFPPAGRPLKTPASARRG